MRLDEHRQTVSDVTTLAVREVRRQWAPTTGDKASRQAQVLLPDVVEAYGSVLASVSAEWYEQVRDEARARGSFTARPVVPLDRQQIAVNARWAVAPLYAAVPDHAAALARMEGVTQRLVANADRATVMANTRRDPQAGRWYRAASGKCCAMCAMLASRGAVYRSQETADFKTHNSCHCFAAPAFVGQEPDLPDYYDAYAKAYTQAVESVGSASTKPVLAEMRTILGTN